MSRTIPVITNKEGKKFLYINYHRYYSEMEGKEMYSLTTSAFDYRMGKTVNMLLGLTDNIGRAVRWSIALVQLKQMVAKDSALGMKIQADLRDIKDLPLEYRGGKFEKVANRYDVKIPATVPYDIYDEEVQEKNNDPLENLVDEIEDESIQTEGTIEHVHQEHEWPDTPKPEISAEPFVPKVERLKAVDIADDGEIINFDDFDPKAALIESQSIRIDELEKEIENLTNDAFLRNQQLSSLLDELEVVREQNRKLTDKMIDLL